ncbi:MAG: N-acetylneuraminate synthase family protein [Chloroflexi bacterium]|nr:N-acetylneuraminate synthase family protein [Chloroflexota bacterium]
MKTITIGGRAVGDGQACFFIAEAGVNHNGSVELAKKLVDVAHECGADAVKFQKRSVEDILIAEALERPYLSATALGPTYGEHRKKLELSEDEYRDLWAHAEQRGIIMLASAWDPKSADFLDELGVQAFKTASADLTNLPLLAHIACKGKPMLISTGMADMSEIEDAIEVVRRLNDQIVLLQCTSLYPCDNDKLNLRAMPRFRERFDVLVGYSGHERGLAPSEAAAALGACVIERHFTVDRTMVGPDHAASLEPEGLRRLIRNIRNIERALGDGEKHILPEERTVRDRLAKSLVAARDIPAGATIAEEMLTVKGPGSGLPPRDVTRVCGRVAQRSIPADTLIPVEALEWVRG